MSGAETVAVLFVAETTQEMRNRKERGHSIIISQLSKVKAPKKCLEYRLLNAAIMIHFFDYCAPLRSTSGQQKGQLRLIRRDASMMSLGKLISCSQKYELDSSLLMSPILRFVKFD